MGEVQNIGEAFEFCIGEPLFLLYVMTLIVNLQGGVGNQTEINFTKLGTRKIGNKLVGNNWI